MYQLHTDYVLIIFESNTNREEGKARFDTRLSRDKKLIIERATMLGGYKNLSDFIVSTVYERAQMIIQQSETILASQKDQEIFFDALVNPPEPNDALVSAVLYAFKQ